MPNRYPTTWTKVPNREKKVVGREDRVPTADTYGAPGLTESAELVLNVPEAGGGIPPR
ncbi:hypothetical protein MSZK_03640 [Mycobacterium sp. shizuoka-1]|nr:hypothetical protein MSZK_03640 [Mycobacterium sp. shizuoka-1]